MRTYIIDKLKETVDALIKILKEYTINDVAAKYDFVVTYITEKSEDDISDAKYSLTLLESAKYSFDEITEKIYTQQKNISWVDLTMLYSDGNRTVICVSLVKRNKKRGKINFHCGIFAPHLDIDGDKFDLNEQLYKNKS